MEQKIGDALRARLHSATERDTFDVNLFMAGEPLEVVHPVADAGDIGAAPETTALPMDATVVAERLRQQATKSQLDVLNFLIGFGNSSNLADAYEEVFVPKVSTVESFWINNAVGAEVSLDVLQSLIERPDVVYVELSRRADIAELIDAPKSKSKVKASSKTKDTVALTEGAGPQNGNGLAEPGAFDLLNFIKSSGRLIMFADAAEPNAPPPQPTWSVKRVGAPLLWQLGIKGDDVLVAVIDTGVNYRHPDLKNRMWDGGTAYPNHGYNFATNNNDPDDRGAKGIGHGTACAGIVSGDGSSGVQTGVAPGSRVMALRVGDDEHSFWRAFQFAIDNRAQVISMSMTWKADRNPDYPGWRRICEAVLAAGILHANSTGNEGIDSKSGPLTVPFNIGAPGNCPPPRLHPLQTPPVGADPHLSSVISCGSTDASDRLLPDSGRSPCTWESAPYTDYPFAKGTQPGLIKPDVCAPGSLTDSCNWQFYGNTEIYTPFNGTSSATAHVGGCMALLAQACIRSGNPIIPARVQEALEHSAVRIQDQVNDKEINYGAGRVDVFAAFNYGKNKNWWA